MKKLTAAGLACIVFTLYCQNSEVIHLKQVWATPPAFKTPESVLYDESNSVLYVSNINGDPSAKDGNGFISRLSLEGRILTPEWIGGLDAPKGMGMLNGFLYVADIDRLVKIDIRQAVIVQAYTITGARFLNDVAVCKDGGVYVSDTMDHTIYVLRDDSVTVFFKADTLDQPNGLFCDNNRLLVGTNGKIISIDLGTRSAAVLLDNTGIIDGLAAYTDHSYIISDWAGKVRLVNKNQRIILSDTTAKKINAADICVIPQKKLLLIPTFNDNRVTAYELP
jgi:hypothetical protein